MRRGFLAIEYVRRHHGLQNVDGHFETSESSRRTVDGVGFTVALFPGCRTLVSMIEAFLLVFSMRIEKTPSWNSPRSLGGVQG